MAETTLEQADALLAEREARLVDQLATLTAKPTELGNISFGKRVGEGTSMAVDRLTAVSAQEELLTMLDDVRRARERVVDGSYGTVRGLRATRSPPAGSRPGRGPPAASSTPEPAPKDHRTGDFLLSGHPARTQLTGGRAGRDATSGQVRRRRSWWPRIRARRRGCAAASTS